MLIWKGWGLLALLVPAVCSWTAAYMTGLLYGADYYTSNEWAMPTVIGASSILVSYIGHKLNNRPSRVVVDIETNEQLELKSIHSFFWIPLQYWGIINIAISIWMYLANIGLIYS